MTRAPTIPALWLLRPTADVPYPEGPLMRRGRRKTEAEAKEAEQRKAARKRQKDARKASR